MNEAREPKGVSTGGRYASRNLAEPNLKLDSHPRGGGAFLAKDMPLAGLEPNIPGGIVLPTEAAQHLNEHVGAARISEGLSDENGSDYFGGRARTSTEVAAALMDPYAGPDAIRSKGETLRSSLPEPDSGDELLFIENPLTGRRCQQLAGHFMNEAIAAKARVPSKPNRTWTSKQWEEQGAFTGYVEAAVRFSDGVENQGGTASYSTYEGRAISLIRDGETDVDNILKTIWNED